MKNYVVGFMFNVTLDKVLLIKKDHPDWQKGKLNGVGGKREGSEFSRETMVREFNEEAGCETVIKDWMLRLVMFVKDQTGMVVAEVLFYMMVGAIERCHTVTSEQIEIHNVVDIARLPVVENLKWIIPLILDTTVEGPISITIH
jgi:8-oxo-dGTP diphosphatase